MKSQAVGILTEIEGAVAGGVEGVYHRNVVRHSERIPRTLFIAFGAAILIPCGIVVFFGIRAVGMESRFAQTHRKERLKRVADLLSMQVSREMEGLRMRAESALQPLREEFFEREAAEKGVVAFARGERYVRCGVLFDAGGRILGPLLNLPFGSGRRKPPERKPEPDLPIDTLAEDPVETAMAQVLERLAMRKRLKEALLEEEVKKEPLQALGKLKAMAKEAQDLEMVALAFYHISRIRLALGDAREAAEVAEEFITKDLSGPDEGGMPLRGRMFLLWARAWSREGSPGRALEILFWFWSEVLQGRYDMEEEAFRLITGELAKTVEGLIAQSPSDPQRWVERLRNFQQEGADAHEKAEERVLLEREVVPQVAREGGREGEMRFRAFLLKDRLEVFLFFPPAVFELGLPKGQRMGAGFRLNVEVLVREGFGPIVEALSSQEATVGLLGPGGNPVMGSVTGMDPMTWPLPEPFNAWRVTVAPGRADPESRVARSRMVFHTFLMACAVLAVVGAGGLMVRSYRRATQLAALRSEFVSTVTHDLKTPLTSIRMFTETLRMGRLKDEERVGEYYGFIADSVDRLEQLIDNILEFARIEAGLF
jgi:hypothetical protein